MEDDSYGTLAGVYEWLVPEPLHTPEGSVAAFAEIVNALDPETRVLDCAAGRGELGVGLRLKGFDVVASDASAAMIERARRLAADRGVELPLVTCSWEQLVEQGWSDSFDVVFCVGNSITHAGGRAARRSALRKMAATLRSGGLLVLTSRNWELVRDQGSGLRIGDRLVERDGRRGLVVHSWTLAEDWDDPHFLDVAVAFVEEDGTVTSHAERLAFWPFGHETLDEDLRTAGLAPASSTYTANAERYLVTARLPTNGAR
jgi:SAM-dependent methyltransferase